MNEPNGLASKQDVFEVYKQAVERFRKACHAFRDADCERNESEKALHEVSQRIAQVLQESVQDPTIPQPVPMNPSPNVQNGGGNLRGY